VLLVAGALIAAVLYQLLSTANQPSVGARAGNGAVAAPAAPDVGRHWFVGEAIVTGEVRAGDDASDGAVRRSAQLHVFNPGALDAQIQVQIYRANGAPRTFRLKVAPDTLSSTDLATRSEIPRGELFWLVLDADRPVFPQVARAEHRPWDPVPDTLDMVLPQAGPADATFMDWIYPDGFQGGGDRWVESETISLLNAGARAGRATLTFQFRDGRPSRTYDVSLPAARLVDIDLSRIFGGSASAPAPEPSGDYATRIVSDVPVVSQQTRRARWRDSTFVVGSKTGAPVRVSESRRARDWYYAGGWIRPLGILPRDRHDHTWQLLFSHSLAPDGGSLLLQAYPDADGVDARTVALPPARSDLQWLHEDPWRTRLGIGNPWGLHLSSASPIAAGITAAEYEPWSQGLPGAMSTTPLMPGPLATEWWLGIARHIATDEAQAEWTAAWQLLNPGTSTRQVTLRFHRESAAPIAHHVTVTPGTVLRVSGDDVPGIATGQPMMVSAMGDGPFLAHAWLRVATRGTAVARALTSAAGVPVSLGPPAPAASRSSAPSH